MKTFGWSLLDIDNTDIESLLPFIYRLTGSKDSSQKTRQVFCDQVNFL